MRKFRVRLTANARIERFVTITVSDDAHNPDMVALALADQQGRMANEYWTVIGSAPDRLGDLGTVKMADVRDLPSSVGVSDATELVDGVEILRVTASGSQRVAFFATNPDDVNEASIKAEAELDNRRRTSGARVSYILQDTFGA